MKKNTVFLIVFFIFVSASSYAHNTNVTHPLLTLEAIRLIEKSEKTAAEKQYQELYRSAKTGFSKLNPKPLYKDITEYPFYWGVWNTDAWNDKRAERLYEDFDESEKDEDPGLLSLEKPYQTLFRVNKFNVINGVVREGVLGVLGTQYLIHLN